MCMVDWSNATLDCYSETESRGRKDYKCCECQRVIPKGEKHAVHRGINEGRWECYRTCAGCSWAAQWLVTHCGGWLFCGVLEDLEEHFHKDGSHRRMDHLGLRVRGIRRKWPDGYLAMCLAKEAAESTIVA